MILCTKCTHVCNLSTPGILKSKHFIAMTSNSKLHVMILWRVMSMELNIGNKKAGLKIMILNCEKM